MKKVIMVIVSAFVILIAAGCQSPYQKAVDKTMQEYGKVMDKTMDQYNDIMKQFGN